MQMTQNGFSMPVAGFHHEVSNLGYFPHGIAEAII
jgi:hypothetical protein